MPNPADLTPGAVDIPEAQTYQAEVLNNATELGQKVRCVIPSFAEHLSTDPMPWNAVRGPGGFFYPKKDDTALVVFPAGGPPAIVEWWPSATKPDEPD
jgi:hypothetical protein